MKFNSVDDLHEDDSFFAFFTMPNQAMGDLGEGAKRTTTLEFLSTLPSRPKVHASSTFLSRTATFTKSIASARRVDDMEALQEEGSGEDEYKLSDDSEPTSPSTRNRGSEHPEGYLTKAMRQNGLEALRQNVFNIMLTKTKELDSEKKITLRNGGT
jgi:hypothetical protein